MSKSLIRTVGELLADTDPRAGERFHRAMPLYDESPDDEIRRLNRYWRGELATLTINTISERECLIDQITPTDWLRHFSTHVLPTIRRFNLPSAA